MINLSALRRGFVWPKRMLVLGLPIAIMLGTVLALLLLPGWTIWEAALYAWIGDRLRFMSTPCVLMDLAAIAPSLLAAGANSALSLRLFWLIRLVRLARFGRISVALRALMEALQ